MRSTYDIYCESCLARGQTPPSREWWRWACSRVSPLRQPQSELMRSILADQREFDRERSEGWDKENLR